MNKPIVAALGSLAGCFLGAVGVSYAKNTELNLGIAISGSLFMAFAMYVVAQWKVERDKKTSEPSDMSQNDDARTSQH